MILRTLSLAVVVGCSSPPARAPVAPSEPEDARMPCGTPSDPLVQLVHRDERSPAHPTSTLVIGRGGSWRSEQIVEGKVSNHDGGCLLAADLRALEAALRDARWTTTTGALCEAVSPYAIDIVIGGRVVYTQRTCDGQLLDEASQRAWLEIRRIEMALSPKKF